MAEVIEGRFRPIIVASNMPGEEKPRTVWDNARTVLAHYEKECKDQQVPRIFLIIDAPMLTVGHAGEKCRPTDASGLCFAAARMFTDLLVISEDDKAPPAR